MHYLLAQICIERTRVRENFASARGAIAAWAAYPWRRWRTWSRTFVFLEVVRRTWCWEHNVFSRRYKEHFVLCMCSWGIMIKSMKMTRQCGAEIIDNYISTAALCVIFGLPGLHGSLSKISVPTQGNTARSTISGYGTSNFMHWHNFFSERGTQNTCVFRTCIARQNAYDYLRLLLP